MANITRNAFAWSGWLRTYFWTPGALTTMLATEDDGMIKEHLMYAAVRQHVEFKTVVIDTDTLDSSRAMAEATARRHDAEEPRYAKDWPVIRIGLFAIREVPADTPTEHAPHGRVARGAPAGGGSAEA